MEHTCPTRESPSDYPSGWYASLLGRQTIAGAVALIDQALSSATNFAVGVVLGRMCTKDQFGAYSLGISVAMFFGSLQGALILIPYMIRVPRLRGAARDRYTGSIMVHEACLCSLAALLLGAAAVLLMAGVGPRELAPVMSALVLGVTMVLLREYNRQVCFAWMRMDMVLLLDCCACAAQLGGLALLVFWGRLSAASVWWNLGVASLLAVAAWLVWVRGRIAVRSADVLADFWNNWSFGKWVFASGFVWALVTCLYPWILVGFHGTPAAGVWAACLGIVSCLNPMILGIQNFLGPSIAHAYAQGGRAALGRHALKAALLWAVVLIPLLAVFLSLGARLVALVYGAKYTGSGSVVPLLMASALLGALDFYFSRALFTMRRAPWDFWGSVAGLVMLGVAGVWLVRAFGPLGAAMGMLLCNATGVTVRSCIFVLSLRAAEPVDAVAVRTGEPLPLRTDLEDAVSRP